MNEVIAQTARLTVRNWIETDRDLFHEINSDPQVMAYFPFRRSRAQSDELFDRAGTEDPVARVEQVDTVLHDMILANETAIRMMLIQSLGLAIGGARGGEFPGRQNRRTPLIEAALAPARRQFRAGTLETLVRALALVIGTEGVVACKDVLRLDDSEARKVKRWAIRALVDWFRSSIRALISGTITSAGVPLSPA